MNDHRTEPIEFSSPLMGTCVVFSLLHDGCSECTWRVLFECPSRYSIPRRPSDFYASTSISQDSGALAVSLFLCVV